jgi:hypothetical protein
VAVGLAVGLLAACGGGDAFEVGDVDAQDLLDRSATRMEALRSFAFEVEHENGATEIIGGIRMVSASGAVEGTDRMRLEVLARFANQNIQTGIVITPEGDYLQNPITGRWQRQDNVDISGFFDPASGVTALMRNATEVAVVAGEVFAGVEAYVLQTTLDSGDLRVFVGDAPPGRSVTARVWVGRDDLLVRKIEVAGPLASGDAENIVRRLILSRFDEPAEIAPPR